jgi:hypothetical protein
MAESRLTAPRDRCPRFPGLLLALTALGLAITPAPAGAQGEPELVTDRPDFTESSVVVPRRSIQLESGFTWDQSPGDVRSFNAPELLLRWGVGNRTELRLGPPQYFRIRSGGQRLSGFGDTYLGMKYQIGPAHGFDLAIIPAVQLPTGAGGLTSEGVDPEVKLTWARDLGGPWSLSGMFAFYWPLEPGGRNFAWQPTVSLGRDLGGRWGAFLEYSGVFPTRGGNSSVIHHGYTYSLSRTSQLDAHFGFGISRAAPDFFIGGGYSVRF